MEECVIKLNAGQCGFFETEWYNMFLNTEERTDLDENIKKAICSMYANVLIQVYEQYLEFYNNIKNNKKYDTFYTEEKVEKFICLFQKDIKKYKEYIGIWE